MTHSDLSFLSIMDNNGMLTPRFLPNIATKHNYQRGMYVVDHTLQDLCELAVKIQVRVRFLNDVLEGELEDFWDLSGYHPDLVEEMVIIDIT